MVTLVHDNKPYNDAGKTHAETNFFSQFFPNQKSKKHAELPATLTFSIDAFPCRDCQTHMRNMSCNFNITVTDFTYLDEWVTRFPLGADQHGWLVAAKDPKKIPAGSTFRITINGPSNNRTTHFQYRNGANQASKTWRMQEIDKDGGVV